MTRSKSCIPTFIPTTGITVRAVATSKAPLRLAFPGKIYSIRPDSWSPPPTRPDDLSLITNNSPRVSTRKRVRFADDSYANQGRVDSPSPTRRASPSTISRRNSPSGLGESTRSRAPLRASKQSRHSSTKPEPLPLRPTGPLSTESATAVDDLSDDDLSSLSSLSDTEHIIPVDVSSNVPLSSLSDTEHIIPVDFSSNVPSQAVIDSDDSRDSRQHSVSLPAGSHENPADGTYATLIPKPRGSVTRLKEGGYNLEESLKWECEKYKAVSDTVSLLVERHLVPTVGFRKQDPESLRIVKAAVLSAHPFLVQYENLWPINDFLRARLKYRSAQVKRDAKKRDSSIP